MTKRDVLSVALRVLGLILLPMALQQMVSAIYIQMLMRSDHTTSQGYISTMIAVASLVTVMLLAAGGLLLLFRADGIARYFVREDEEVSIPGAPTNEPAWFCFAVRIVGIVTLTQGVPPLAGTIAHVLSVAGEYTQSVALSDKLGVFLQMLPTAHLESAFYTGLAQVVVGAYLTWGAGQFTRLVFRSRGRGNVAE